MSNLTPAQQEYVQLEREMADWNFKLKPLRDKLNAARDNVVNESQIRVAGNKVFFQDEHGVVHCVEERTHTTVEVHPYGIAHTRRPEFGEAKGSLSEKAAKEAGFEPVINKEAAASAA